MAPHSSTLAWKISWTEEPGRLQPMGLGRIGHDLATSLSLFSCMHWRRKWQPAPVFLSEESQGQWSLMGCRLWGCTESDMTEATQQQQQHARLLSVSKLCLTLCDPMDRSTPGFPVIHHLPEFAQTHVYGVSDTIRPSHSLSPHSPPALKLSQDQDLFP